MELNAFTESYQLVMAKLIDWWETLVSMLPNMVTALLVMLAFVLVAKVSKRIVIKLSSKLSDNRALNRLFSTIVFIAIVSIGIFTALSILKLDKAVTSLLTGAGIIGLALSFAFQDSATNLMSGVFMALRKPFKIGDIVKSGDIEGTVHRMSLRNTIIHSYQGQEIYVPNKEIYQNPLTNYSSLGSRRVDISVGVSYGDDLEQARSIAIKALEDLSFIDKDHDVTLFYNEFGSSSINFTIRFWIDFKKQANFLEARSEAIISIKKAFDKNEITIPFPIRTLDFGIKGGEKLSQMVSVSDNALSAS